MTKAELLSNYQQDSTNFKLIYCWPKLEIGRSSLTGTGKQRKQLFTLCWPRLHMFIEAPQAQVSREYLNKQSIHEY